MGLLDLAVKGAKNLSGVTTALITGKNQLAAAQSDNNKADSTGNLFQRTWRPTLMWGFVIIIWWNWLVIPVIIMIRTGVIETIVLPESMWQLMMLMMGAGFAGREIGKIATKRIDLNKKTTETKQENTVAKPDIKKYRDLGMTAEQLSHK